MNISITEIAFGLYLFVFILLLGSARIFCRMPRKKGDTLCRKLCLLFAGSAIAVLVASFQSLSVGEPSDIVIAGAMIAGVAPFFFHVK